MVSTFYDDGHSAVTVPGNPAESGQTRRPQPAFLTANGSHDSHAVTLAAGGPNGSPRAGTPYPTATWDDIRSLVETPARRPKDRARLVVLSTYNAHDGRTHAVQRERGVFHGLAVDIDKGNPSLSDVVDAVQRVVGECRAEVYSSSSARPDNRKWRVLIPLAEPVAGADYADTQLALFALLAQHGVECDATLSRAAQPVYLPNVPPERRSEDGQPIFYQWRHIDGPDLRLSHDHAVVVQRERMREEAAALRAAEIARAEEYKARRLAHVAATGDDFEPIQHFKDNHTVAEMLARYGFVHRDGGRGNHWRSPLSQSGSYSTEDRGDHWVTVSNWAHAHNVGRVSSSGHRYGDAFDLYAFFEHGGDRREAVRAYAAEVRPRRPDQPDDQGDDLPVEPRPTLPGQCRSLDDWRQEAAARRAAAISQPGLHLDRSPTGSGKTHATVVALRQASSSLTVLPTHANVAERVAEMRSLGVDAVAYPELTSENCQNYDQASHAQSLGLVAGAAVCPGCPFKDDCTYRAGVKIASQAAHRVATHERLRRSPRTAENAVVVVVDESPEKVVAPSLAVPAKQIVAVQTLAHGIKHHWYSEADHDQKAFAGTLLDVVAAISDICGRITAAGTVPVDLRLVARETPKNWQRLLYDAIRQVGVGQNLKAEALALVTKAAVGDLVSLDIVTDETATGKLHHYVVGSWRPGLPSGAAVIMLDATAGADDIEAAIGQPVDDCTPDGHLPAQHQVVQLVDDIGKTTTSVATVAGVVEAFLARHPEVQRLGIIGHQPHITALIDQGELGSEARQRVVKWCYFCQGPDRASNDWHRECDHLLVLGTPRANPGDHRRWLVLHGLHDAAGRDADWGARHWQSVTVDGTAITVAGAAPRDPDWHRAFVAVSRATLHQAVGRGRSILPDGIPVTVVTSEPTPYPIAPPLDVQPAALRATVEVVRGLLAPVPECELSAIENSYREKFLSGAVPTGAIVAAVVAATRTPDKPAGVGRRAVQKRLDKCRQAGMLDQPRRGYWSLPGTPAADPADLVQPVAQPARAAAPAVVPPLQPATVIEAMPPPPAADAVQIVAPETPPAGTTGTSTTDQPAALPIGFDDLVERVEERAAILEHDGGYDRETADRLAREMVLGRDAAVPDPDGAAVQIAAGVDHAALHARSQPLVADVLRRFPGTVRVLTDQDDPFAGHRRHRQPAPGRCKCGADAWKSVPIHGGRSTRIDCGHCDRFGWWGVWHGKPQPSPFDDLDQPVAVPPPADPPPPLPQAAGPTHRLSFDFLPTTHAMPTGPVLTG